MATNSSFVTAGSGNEDFFRSGTAALPAKADGTNDVTENITRAGDTGFGLADPTQVAAKVDVNGAEVLRPVAIANRTANGAIGTAVTTVDVSSNLLLTQTTANISATLPNPTNTQAGRLLYIENGNASTVAIAVNGVNLNPGTGTQFIWSGTAWIGLGGNVEDFWRSGTGATLPDGTNDTTDSITHNGNVGFGLTNPATLAARVDVSGSAVLRALALTNFAANAAIGTAAATVDAASHIVIPQTTANISLTLPNPTNTQSGRILGVLNTGSTPVTVGGLVIPNGVGAQFVWSGTAWIPESSGSAPDFWRSGTGATLPDGVTDPSDAIAHSGNLMLGLLTPNTSAGRFDLTGSTVLRPVALGNFAANAAIGTAAATVDVASTITINQTTANIAVTLPGPTNTQVGRIVTIANIGTVQLKVGVVYLTPGRSASFIWTGAAWSFIGNEASFINVAASRAALATDHLKTILAGAAAITITVNINTFQYGLFRVRQSTNAGIITIAAGAGMTLVAPFSAATLGLAGADTIVEVIGTTVYVS